MATETAEKTIAAAWAEWVYDLWTCAVAKGEIGYSAKSATQMVDFVINRTETPATESEKASYWNLVPPAYRPLWSDVDTPDGPTHLGWMDRGGMKFVATRIFDALKAQARAAERYRKGYDDWTCRAGKWSTIERDGIELLQYRIVENGQPSWIMFDLADEDDRAALLDFLNSDEYRSTCS